MTTNFDIALNSKKNIQTLLADCSRDGLWVFGYGSLIWKPDFEYNKSYKALLHGYYRSFCVYSFHHRGTEQNPGLVMGIKKGSDDDFCQGKAYYIDPSKSHDALINLRKREQINEVYYERYLPIELTEDNAHEISDEATTSPITINALFYEVDKTHIQYAKAIDLDKKVRMIKSAHGLSGDNKSYLTNIYKHLEECNIHDEEISNMYNKLIE